MTENQLHAIAELLRMKPHRIEAARLVLVEGKRPTEVVQLTGLRKQAIYAATSAIRRADAIIRPAFTSDPCSTNWRV